MKLKIYQGTRKCISKSINHIQRFKGLIVFSLDVLILFKVLKLCLLIDFSIFRIGCPCRVLPWWPGELDGEICETIPLRGHAMVLGKSPGESEQAIEIEVNTALGRGS